MNQDKFNGIINSIGDKLGEDVKATIADDLGSLITLNNEFIKELSDRDSKISSLTDTNQKLVASNGALLQQIPQIDPYKKELPKEDINPDKDFDYHSTFDENGNII